MTTKPRCADCKFWFRHRGDDEDEGDCRKNPPTVVPFSTRDVEVVRTVFPITLERECCGAFEARSPADYRPRVRFVYCSAPGMLEGITYDDDGHVVISPPRTVQ